MKHLILCIFAALLALTACKTTEANYRKAYETARSAADGRNKVDPDDGLDENTRRMLARQKASATMTHVVGTDTISVTTLFVKMYQGSHDRVPRYSVVLNAFSQVFNAKAMCSRLKENGFEDAYIFNTATPDYYVAAGGSDSLDSIPAILARVASAGNLGTRSGFPAVICSGGWRPK